MHVCVCVCVSVAIESNRDFLWLSLISYNKLSRNHMVLYIWPLLLSFSIRTAFLSGKSPMITPVIILDFVHLSIHSINRSINQLANFKWTTTLSFVFIWMTHSNSSIFTSYCFTAIQLMFVCFLCFSFLSPHAWFQFVFLWYRLLIFLLLLLFAKAKANAIKVVIFLSFLFCFFTFLKNFHSNVAISLSLFLSYLLVDLWMIENEMYLDVKNRCGHRP